MNVVLLVRSYERPSYLRKTLESLLESDIDLCIKRYIYDDGSVNKTVLDIFNNENLINKKGKEFKIVRSNNMGCKQSYIKALNLIKNDNNNIEDYFICTLDNDVIVKPDFISKLNYFYLKAFDIFKTNNILFTGFNPSNTHLTKIKEYDGFYRKKTAGGINFFFHIKFLNFIVNSWQIGDNDHGVNQYMIKNNYPLLCLNKGVINHIGKHGLWSNGINYDFDRNFT